MNLTVLSCKPDSMNADSFCSSAVKIIQEQDIDKILVSPSYKIKSFTSKISAETDIPIYEELRLSDSDCSTSGYTKPRVLPLSQSELFRCFNIFDVLTEISILHNQDHYLLIIHEEILPCILSYFDDPYHQPDTEQFDSFTVYTFQSEDDLFSKEQRKTIEHKKDCTCRVLVENGFIPLDTNPLLRHTSLLLSQSDILALRKGRFFQKNNLFVAVTGMHKDDCSSIMIESADSAFDLLRHRTTCNFENAVSCDLPDKEFRNTILMNYKSLF